MTPERTKQLLPVFEAFANGKRIQVFNDEEAVWEDVDSPMWLDELNYRVAPAQIEGYLNVYADPNDWCAYPTRTIADASAACHRLACVRVVAIEGTFDK